MKKSTKITAVNRNDRFNNFIKKITWEIIITTMILFIAPFIVEMFRMI